MNESVVAPEFMNQLAGMSLLQKQAILDWLRRDLQVNEDSDTVVPDKVTRAPRFHINEELWQKKMAETREKRAHDKHPPFWKAGTQYTMEQLVAALQEAEKSPTIPYDVFKREWAEILGYEI